jgi:hypothetical protein
MLLVLRSDGFAQDYCGSPRMIGAVLFRIVIGATLLALLLTGAQFIGSLLGADRSHPLAFAPFFVTPLVIAWFMPGSRWLFGYALLIALMFLVGMALSGMPGGAGIAPAMFALAVTSGAGAGFLAGVIGRSVGLALVHAGRSPLTAWSAQIATALVFAAAAALAPLAFTTIA